MKYHLSAAGQPANKDHERQVSQKDLTGVLEDSAWLLKNGKVVKTQDILPVQIISE